MSDFLAMGGYVGASNAGTSGDTPYAEIAYRIPADRWEVALEIESNRMRNSNCPQAEFDAEKKVVLNELWIGLDDPQDVRGLETWLWSLT